jgi:hypothetical protein
LGIAASTPRARSMKARLAGCSVSFSTIGIPASPASRTSRWIVICASTRVPSARARFGPLPARKARRARRRGRRSSSCSLPRRVQHPRRLRRVEQRDVLRRGDDDRAVERDKRYASRRRLCVVCRSCICGRGSKAGNRGIADSQIRSTSCRYRRASCVTRCTFSSSERQDRQILCAGSGLRNTNYQAKSRVTYLCQGPFRPKYQPRVHRSQL